MYKSIIETIKSKLGEITAIQEVKAYPMGEDETFTAYPAVIFLPDNLSNSFSDTGSNHRTLQFKMWVVINGSQLDRQKLWERVLPNAVDAVMEKFDADWDFGTVDGHRVWSRLSAGITSMSVEEQSLVVTQELTLIIRFDKSI